MLINGENRNQSSPSAGRRLPDWVVLALTFWCLATAAGGWWYYSVQKREVEAVAMRETFAVASSKATQIANWRRERMGNGHVLLSSPVMHITRRILANSATTEADRADLTDVMRRLAKAYLYTDITLVDLNGNVRVRLRADEAPQFAQSYRAGLARKANQANDIILSDPVMETRSGKPLMAMTVPVRDLGAVILDIDPSRFLYPYLEPWAGPSKTGECLLGRIEGDYAVYLNPRLQASESAPLARRRVADLLPPLPVLDNGWTQKDLDYRGVPVIGTVRRIPDSPWYLVAKMDIAEAHAPLGRLGWEMALIVALIGFANATGAGLVWRRQQARFHREREVWFYAMSNDTPAYLWMSVGEENSFINRPLQMFLGAAQQKLSYTWTDYIHPDEAVRVRSAFLEALAHARPSSDEFRMRRFDGEYRLFAGEAVPRFSPAGQFLGYAGAVVDITDRRHAEEELRAANAKLAAELEERVRKEQEIQALSARLIGAREQERQRLARELHDDLNQQIAAVSIAVSNLKRHIPPEPPDARSQSDRIHEKLVQLAETVRRMSHELHPAILEYRGLAAALRACCDEFAALTRIRVTWRAEGRYEDVPAPVALCVFRITQEALQNVAKHAHADSAIVELSRYDGHLRLHVSDTGIGIDPARTQGHSGLGLLSMKERARLCGGHVEIGSAPGQGASVTLTVPLCAGGAEPVASPNSGHRAPARE